MIKRIISLFGYAQAAFQTYGEFVTAAPHADECAATDNGTVRGRVSSCPLFRRFDSYIRCLILRRKLPSPHLCQVRPANHHHLFTLGQATIPESIMT